MSREFAARRREALAQVQRRQILEGFAAAFAEKGFAATTIGDIAREARVSKSTFYEHFADKEAAFVGLHDTVREAVAATVAQAAVDAAALPDWRARVRHVVAAYLDVMASNPLFITQLLMEASAAGPIVRKARDGAMDEFAAALVQMSTVLAEGDPEVAPLSGDMARAALGGLLELVFRASARSPKALRAVEDPATELFTRLLRAPDARA